MVFQMMKKELVECHHHQISRDLRSVSAVASLRFVHANGCLPALGHATVIACHLAGLMFALYSVLFLLATVGLQLFISLRQAS